MEIAIGAAAIGAAIAIPGGGIAIDGVLIASHAAAVGALTSIAGSMIMSGLADALHGNQGGLAEGVSTPIGPWGYVYGTQKVGGVLTFCETNDSQGVSNDKQLHRVYTLACHPCLLGDFQLLIGGQPVLLTADGAGWSSYSPTQVQQNITSISRSNGVVTMQLTGAIPDVDGETLQVWNVEDNTFNGTFIVTQPDPSDETTFTYVCGGPDTTSSGGSAKTTYPDFSNKIYLELIDGNHTATFEGLLSSGTTWGPNDLCLGRTLAYVRMGYDAAVFPSIPNVSFVIQGKSNIFDPRTGRYGWTDNAALCIADYLCVPTTQGGFGMTMGTDIPTAQLIAAANICDEQVDLAGGGSINRYTCDTFFQLNTPRGGILKDLLSSCAGRISYQGGQYSIFPGAWVAPTLQLSDADLTGPIDLAPRLSIRDTCNAVKGTYISPENAYQQADVPMYAQDTLHGYVSDPWLAEDNNERIIREANFPCTNNSATAQRLEKIALLRTRFQQRLNLTCSLAAYQATALDVIQFSHPRYNWVNKNFEVLSSSISFAQDAAGRALIPKVQLALAETDPSIFDWNLTDQLTPQGYQQPNSVGVRICAPPENVEAYSGPGATINGITYPSTISTGADGRVQNSIYVCWTTPNDQNVVSGGHLEVQWQPVGSSTWNALANINPTASSVFITGVSDGSSYNVQVRAVNVANVPSAWVAEGPVTVSNALSSLAYSGIPVAQSGTLSAQGISGGTANITIQPFTAKVGSATASCTPSPSMLTGLNQAQLYYVYYVDLNFAGGTITPIATQNPADFEDKAGYFLIGSIITPSYTARYQPSSYSDIGSQTTINPTAAYDNDTTTYASVSAMWQTFSAEVDEPPINTSGDCIWSGFPSFTTTSSLTLHCLASAIDDSEGVSWTGTITVTGGGSSTAIASFYSATAQADYTWTVPSGTNLSTLAVEAAISISQGAAPTDGSTAAGGTAYLDGFEIYIQ